MAYQPLVNDKQVGLLEALRVRAETKRQAAAIHAHKLLERYGKPIRNKSDAEEFLRCLREKRGLSDCPTRSRRYLSGNSFIFNLSTSRMMITGTSAVIWKSRSAWS